MIELILSMGRKNTLTSSRKPTKPPAESAPRVTNHAPASITTTSIYATADSQMVRDAIQKAAGTTPDPAPLWKGNDDLILQLAGLT